jgi:hypothetical protein
MGRIIRLSSLLCAVITGTGGCQSPTGVTKEFAKVNSVTYERVGPFNAAATGDVWLTLWHLRIGDTLSRSDEINCPLQLIDEDTFACTRVTPLGWNVPVDVDSTIWVDDPAVTPSRVTSRIRVNGTLVTRVVGTTAKFRIESSTLAVK